ncbi:MAG: 16S rRNA (uracil(1498)-N(3))-methyltransferase [Oscillospiraceae bacterium]|nr:16S rRNA (uracil(1498)-N(3))-methyltransferase [Oscillospiraceae bacterium]
MPRFFIDGTADGRAYIAGADALHIAKALRMRPGEALTLCDGKGTDFEGVLETVTDRQVTVRITASRPSQAEPTLAVTLYQGLPKGDKMDWIIQKAVELGVTAVVPVATRRSVARLEGKADKKQERWQRIAAEAAGQCGRGILPAVERPLSWNQALSRLSGEPALVFYEGGGRPLRELVTPSTRRLSVFVGPEGGFDPEEIDAIRRQGGGVATLGPRILRCETAPLAALTLLMHLSGNME